MGVEISPMDVDIVHRIQYRNKQSSLFTIICNFTRRTAKDAVMQKKSEISYVDREKIGLPAESENSMKIYEKRTRRKTKSSNVNSITYGQNKL